MADEGSLFSRCVETLRAYDKRAEKPGPASAHRLLAVQYEADADELRREIAAQAQMSRPC